MHNDIRYSDINNGRDYPPLTRDAAHTAALRILEALGSPSLCAFREVCSPFVGDPYLPTRKDLARIYRRWTDGGKTGRRCWASTKPTRGHDKGWGRLIHDVSHMLQQYRHPKLRPHDSTHHQIERDVQLYVETSGMLDPVPQAIERVRESIEKSRAARYVNLCERLKRWETKRKRAETAIRKLARQKRRLESLRNVTQSADNGRSSVDTTHHEDHRHNAPEPGSSRGNPDARSAQ